MTAEDADFAVVQLDLLLSRLHAHRGDSVVYAALAEEVIGQLEAVTGLVDSQDPNLMELNRRLLCEFVFAAKSAQLRSPIAYEGEGAIAGTGRMGY
mgnify:CR=1 FL=1